MKQDSRKFKGTHTTYTIEIPKSTPMEV